MKTRDNMATHRHKTRGHAYLAFMLDGVLELLEFCFNNFFTLEWVAIRTIWGLYKRKGEYKTMHSTNAPFG
jgi:hypothetical protein